VDNNKIDNAKQNTYLAGNFDYHGDVYFVGCIAQWSTSQASLEATGCHHWASAWEVLPRRLPRSTISNETKKQTKHNF
jgi:hypothetical protein